MKVSLPTLGMILALLLAMGYSQHTFSVNALKEEAKALKRGNDRLRWQLDRQTQLTYLAVNYGTDARQDHSRRLLPLEHFALPLEDRPLWMQADDALIQFIRESDSLRVDTWRVVADTGAVYMDKALLPPEAF